MMAAWSSLSRRIPPPGSSFVTEHKSANLITIPPRCHSCISAVGPVLHYTHNSVSEISHIITTRQYFRKENNVIN